MVKKILFMMHEFLEMKTFIGIVLKSVFYTSVFQKWRDQALQ